MATKRDIKLNYIFVRNLKSGKMIVMRCDEAKDKERKGEVLIIFKEKILIWDQ